VSEHPSPAAGTAEIKRILFVDDEQDVLDGLRDALRPYRRQWTMTFVTTGEDALAALENAPYDVVVSDLRMPSMDGATLLQTVRTVSPSAVRIVLSGYAEPLKLARAAGVAHQLLAKPCETEYLARVITRSCAIREISTRVSLNRRTMGASVLPSVPRLYRQLTDALSSGEPSIADVCGIVEQDMAMAAKVLGLANSAYFGRRHRVTGIADAIVYLGLEALQTLVLQAGAFSEFAVNPPIPGFELDQLQRHCCRVGHLARSLLDNDAAGADAFAAGLLHDIGLLVLATEEREELTAILVTAQRERRPVYEVERERCSVTHAEIGAHLMALWGLPPSVTAGVGAQHDVPSGDLPFDEVAAIYVANILVEEAESQITSSAVPACEIDLDYLEQVGVADRLPRWRELAARQVEQTR
jgi:HD-like signal output (HDOD) protein